MADARTLAVVCGPFPQAKERESVVCLVDVATLKEVRQLAPEKETQGAPVNAFQSLALAPGGKVLATANGSGEVRLWDINTGTELRRCQGGRSVVGALAFSADGKMLAGVDRGLVRLWETESGKEVSSAGEGHKRLVSSVAFTPDGATLVSSSWDGLWLAILAAGVGCQRQPLFHFAPVEGTVTKGGKSSTTKSSEPPFPAGGERSR